MSPNLRIKNSIQDFDQISPKEVLESQRGARCGRQFDKYWPQRAVIILPLLTQLMHDFTIAVMRHLRDSHEHSSNYQAP